MFEYLLRSLFGAIGSVFGWIGIAVNKAFLIAMTAVICFFFWILQIFSRGMLSAGMFKQIFVLAGLWFLIWLSSSVLILAPSLKLASLMMTIVGVLLFIQTSSYFAPGTVAAIQTIATYQDQKNLQAAERAVTEVIQQSFDCNKSNIDGLRLYGRNGVTGARVSLVFWARDPDTNRIVCFTERGLNPKTGRPVNDMTEEARKEIRGQKPPDPPALPHIVVAAVRTTRRASPIRVGNPEIDD